MSDVKLVEAAATVLDPNKKYILTVSSDDFTMDNAHKLGQALKDEGIHGIVVKLDSNGKVSVIESE